MSHRRNYGKENSCNLLFLLTFYVVLQQRARFFRSRCFLSTTTQKKTRGCFSPRHDVRIAYSRPSPLPVRRGHAHASKRLPARLPLRPVLFPQDTLPEHGAYEKSHTPQKTRGTAFLRGGSPLPIHQKNAWETMAMGPLYKTPYFFISARKSSTYFHTSVITSCAYPSSLP